MATKEAVFSLKVDTGNSVNDIKSFDQAVNSLNKDVNTLQGTVQEGAGTDVFAQKLTDLNAKVEAGGLTMREMTKTMKEYQNIAAQAGLESPIGQQAIAAAGSLKDGIGDIKSQVNALSSDTVKLDTAMGALQGGAAVFQGISSAIALTGVENEDLMQTMVKLQAVQGVMNSINEVAILLNEEHVVGMQLRAFYEKAYALAVGTSTGALKIFRLALVATGIGALVVGLGLLVANWDKVTGAIGKAVSSFNKLGTGVKIVIGIFMPLVGIIMLVVKGLQMLGLVEDDEDKKRAATHAKRMTRIQKQMEKERELRAAQKQAFDNQQKQFDREIALAEALGQSTVKLRQQKIQASIDVQKEQIKEYENGIKALDLLFKNNSFMAGIHKEKRADAKANLNKMNQDVLDQENEKKIIQINANKDAQDEAKDNAKKLADIEKARLDNIAEQQRQLDADILTALNEFEDSKQTARQLEENKINEYYFNLITQAQINKKSKDDIAQLEAAQADKIRKNTAKFDKEDQQKYEDSLKKRQSALRMYQGFVLDEYQLALVDFDNTQKDEVKTLEDNLAAKLISQDNYFAALEAMKIARDKKIIELDKKKAADERDANVKKFEEDTKALTDGLAAAAQGLDLAGQMNAAINEIQDAKLAAMQKETDAQLTELETRKEAELKNANLTAAQKQAINDKYALIAYNLEKKQFDAAEKLRKQQFIREKALKIASIAISTAEAVMKAIATGGGIPTGIPFGVATGVVGAAQLAAVMSTKYEGGTAPSMPDVGASGGVSSGASASSFAPNTNAQTTSLADYLPGGANGPGISQVVVLESDITGTQQKVAAQQSLSTY
jgi:hypothetical protein